MTTAPTIIIMEVLEFLPRVRHDPLLDLLLLMLLVVMMPMEG